MTPMHVLIVPTSYPALDTPISGIFVQDQVRALSQRGHRVGVIVPKLRSLRTWGPRASLHARYQIRAAEEGGVPTLRVDGWNPLVSRLRRPLIEWMVGRLYRRYVAQYGMPDLVHAHNLLWTGAAIAPLCLGSNTPFVVTEHSSEFLRGLVPERERKRLSMALRQAAAVVAVSRHLGAAVERELGRPARAEVIPNIVDIDAFPQRQDAPPDSPFRFLSVTTLRPVKRIDRLIRAFASVCEAGRASDLRIVGTGVLDRSCRALARSLGVADRVQFLGHLDRPAIAALMRSAGALVISSDVETFGIVAVEALASGCPVVATRCGGPEEIVLPGTGLLVDRTTPALADGMLQMASAGAPLHPSELRRASLRYVAASVVKQLEQLYGEVTSAR